MGTIYQVNSTPTQILYGTQDDITQLTNSSSGLIYYGNDSSLTEASESGQVLGQSLLPYLEPGASVVIEPYTVLWALYNGVNNFYGSTTGTGTLTSTDGVSNKIAYSQANRQTVIYEKSSTAGTLAALIPLTYDQSMAGNIQSITVIVENLASFFFSTPSRIDVQYQDLVSNPAGTLQTSGSIQKMSYPFTATSPLSRTAIMETTFGVNTNSGAVQVNLSTGQSAGAFVITVIANSYPCDQIKTHQSAECFSLVGSVGLSQQGSIWHYESGSISLASGATYYYPLPAINSEYAAVNVGITTSTNGSVSGNLVSAYSTGNYVQIAPTIVTFSTTNTVNGFANSLLIPKGYNAVQIVNQSTATITNVNWTLAPSNA
jgi:hypothetical protein